jgi:hypothetical protein
MSTANEIRSRRSVLAVLAGGATALAAQALGRPAPARAANGDPVLAGRSVTASARTEVRTTAGNAIEGVTSAPGKIGVFGITETTDGRGVHGLGAAFGVSGEAIAGYAVYGERPLGGIPADGYPCPAIEGRSFPPFGESNVNATAGVAGYSGNVVRGSPPVPPKATGVFGYSPAGQRRPRAEPRRSWCVRYELDPDRAGGPPGALEGPRDGHPGLQRGRRDARPVASEDRCVRVCRPGRNGFRSRRANDRGERCPRRRDERYGSRCPGEHQRSLARRPRPRVLRSKRGPFSRDRPGFGHEVGYLPDHD